MSKNKRSSYSATMADINQDLKTDKAVPQASRRPTSVAGFAQGIHELGIARQRVEELQAQVTQLEKEGRVLDLPVDSLREVPGRRRKLSDDEMNLLVENLRNNPLITPIIVRKLSDHTYEIVAGHNRTHVFKMLGRPTIRAIVSNIDDGRVNTDAFYANLIHPSLPDYEKYRGFKQQLNDNPDMTQENLAQLSGLSAALISYLMAFDRLPEAAHQLLTNNPKLIGSRTASELAQACGEGKGDLVVKSLTLLANKEIATEEKAIAYVKSSQTKKPERPQPIERRFKSGKAAFCTYKRAENIVRLDFKTIEEAERIQAILFDLLETESKRSAS